MFVIPAFEHWQFQGRGEIFWMKGLDEGGEKKWNQKDSQISRQCKLEQCCWSQSSSDNLQKPKCCSRMFSEHKSFVLLCLPLSKQKMLTESENLLALKETHFHQLWEDFGQVHALQLWESSRLFLNLDFFGKLKLLIGINESLQHSSASASKLDGPIAVIQLKCMKRNLTSSSSISHWSSVKKS